jgi:drug/metabolite transporter (DMT)-like permease
MAASSPSRFVLYLSSVLAVVGFSLAGPLLRLRSDALGSLGIAFWRLALTTAVTAGIWAVLSRRGRRIRSMSLPGARPALGAAIASGAFLAIHFGAWIASLDYIPVAASVVLVNTMPIFAALLSRFFLREPLHGTQWIGLALALLGALWIVAPGFEFLDPDPNAAPRAMAGEGAFDPADRIPGALLAILGAVCGAAYFVCGRTARRSLGLWNFVTLTYGIASGVLLLACLLSHEKLWPFPASDGLVLAGLVIGPTLLGHTVVNWVIRWVPASIVNSISLGEPLVAGVWAYFLFGESPSGSTIAGGLAIVFGVFVVVRFQHGPPAARDAREP